MGIRMSGSFNTISTTIWLSSLIACCFTSTYATDGGDGVGDKYGIEAEAKNTLEVVNQQTSTVVKQNGTLPDVQNKA